MDQPLPTLALLSGGMPAAPEAPQAAVSGAADGGVFAAVVAALLAEGMPVGASAGDAATQEQTGTPLPPEGAPLPPAPAATAASAVTGPAAGAAADAPPLEALPVPGAEVAAEADGDDADEADEGPGAETADTVTALAPASADVSAPSARESAPVHADAVRDALTGARSRPAVVVAEGPRTTVGGDEAALTSAQAQVRAPEVPAAVVAPPPRADVPPPPSQPALAPAQPDFADALAERVQWVARGEQGSARIQLDPPHLGQVEVRVTVHQDQVQVQFHVQQGAAADALQAALPRLRELLAEQGMVAAQVGVQQQAAGHGGDGDRARDGAGGGRFTAAPEDEPVAASAPVRRGRGLVDTYV